MVPDTRVDVPEVQVYEPKAQPEPIVPCWGRRGTLWEWLVVAATVAILALLIRHTTGSRVAEQGSAAFPQWMWDVYDWRLWPLCYFR